MITGFLLGLAGCGTATGAKNKEKAFALEYYQADALANDPARAWEMMNDHKRKGHGSREQFFQLVNMRKPAKMPQDLTVKEWREPAQQGYTYLIKGGEGKPWVVVVVSDDTGGLSVLDAYLYKGGDLP